MEKVGIIVAMEEEMIALKKKMTDIKEYKIFDIVFFEGQLSSVNTILALSGVGKVNAARTTQILIDNMQVDYIFNIGVGCAVNENLDVLDVIVGEKLVQHDFDITAFEHEKGYIPNIGVFIETDKYLRKLTMESCNDEKRIFEGIIASGDIFCTNKEMESKIHKKFNALCVEMEGASIAQVCYLSHIPFLVIRSISDTIKKDNTIAYEEFLLASSEKVSQIMVKVLQKIHDDKL